MAKFFHESDLQPSTIQALKVTVIGYGSQGHAHALNLKDSGVEVCTGLYEGSKSWPKAEADGITVMTVAEATQWADVLMFCTPDVPMARIYREGVEPHLREGQMLLFAHGLNIHYQLIQPPKHVDVALVAPKGPGHRLRSEFMNGSGLPCLVAVHQDATGQALDRTLSYAWGIGGGRALILETTFKEEAETDLFGEQAVLCGGIPDLIKAGFETLVEAGFQPEAAYFECLHEAKLIVDLLYAGGLTLMQKSISDTAEWGGYQSGKRVINAESRAAMRAVLSEIQDGTFIRRWTEENDQGLKEMEQHRTEVRKHPAEEVGAKLRERMPFLKS